VHQARPVLSEATTAAPAVDVEEQSPFAKYGFLPFAGLGAAALLSKEVLIFDIADSAYLKSFLDCMIIYIAAGSYIHNAATQENDERAKELTNLATFKYEAHAMMLKSMEASLGAVSILKEIKRDYREVVTKVNDAQKQIAAVDLTNDVIKRLDSLKASEGAAAAKAEASLADEALIAISYNVYYASAEEKQKWLDMAINDLGADEDIEAHPIVKDYNQLVGWEAEATEN
jgi:hypothetical protein